MRAQEILDALSNVSTGQAHGGAFVGFLYERVEKHWKGDHDAVVEPIGWLMLETLAAADLARGIDGFTGEKIQSQACGLPPLVYALIGRIVRRSFTQEFQDGIARVEDEAKHAAKAT
jgi:hypothetical protein